MDSNEIGVNGGLAVANAMVNKDNLKVLNLDGNQFGKWCGLHIFSSGVSRPILPVLFVPHSAD